MRLKLASELRFIKIMLRDWQCVSEYQTASLYTENKYATLALTICNTVQGMF